jgi:hypothetical protein
VHGKRLLLAQLGEEFRSGRVPHLRHNGFGVLGDLTVCNNSSLFTQYTMYMQDSLALSLHSSLLKWLVSSDQLGFRVVEPEARFRSWQQLAQIRIFLSANTHSVCSIVASCTHTPPFAPSG